MKIIEYGKVVLQEGRPVQITDWNVEREPSDPPLEEATSEQLLLEVVLNWTKEYLTRAINTALLEVARERRSLQALAGDPNKVS